MPLPRKGLNTVVEGNSTCRGKDEENKERNDGGSTDGVRWHEGVPWQIDTEVDACGSLVDCQEPYLKPRNCSTESPLNLFGTFVSYVTIKLRENVK